MERETAQSQVKHANPRYLTDEQGKRVGVVLSVEEYEALIDELEELEDIRDAKEVKAAIARGEEEVTSLEEALPRIEAERERLRREGLV